MLSRFTVKVTVFRALRPVSIRVTWSACTVNTVWPKLSSFCSSFVAPAFMPFCI